MTAQGPELRALADTLREAGETATPGDWRMSVDESGAGFIHATELGLWDTVTLPTYQSDADLIVLLRNNLPTIISALERAADAELPDPKGGCVCVAYPQDAGGGYTEWLAEYEPATPTRPFGGRTDARSARGTRAAAAEGEKAEGRYPTPRADSMSSSVQPMPDPYRGAS